MSEETTRGASVDYGDWLDNGGGGGDPDDWDCFLIDDDEEEGPQA